jgi:hypothetical protein
VLAFIFIGGGGNVRKKYIGPLGHFQCPNCRQVSQWDVYDIEKRATAFFVPVFKYASQRVIICSRCGAGAEVTKAEIASLQRSLAHQSQPPASAPASSKTAPPADLDAWLDEVARYLAGWGYAETGRDGYEECTDCPGLYSLASAMYENGGTKCQLALFDDPASAQRWVSYVATSREIAPAVARGMLKIDSTDRLAYLAHNPRGISARDFRRWAAMAVHVAPLGHGIRQL